MSDMHKDDVGDVLDKFMMSNVFFCEVVIDTRVSVATSAYACFDLAIVLPTLLCTPGEVFVLVGLVLVSHAMCFVCECVCAQFSSLHVLCVCTVFIIACAVVSAFVL